MYQEFYMKFSEIAFNTNFVSSLTGASLKRLSYWDQTNLIKPSVLKADGKGTIRLYSFEDLIEIKTVIYLLNSGVNLPQIRLAVEYIRAELDFTRPLKDIQLISNGKDVLCTAENINETFREKNWVAASQYGQTVMPFVVPLGFITSDIVNKVTELNTRVEQGRKQQQEGNTIAWDSIKDNYVSGNTNKRSRKRSSKAS